MVKLYICSTSKSICSGLRVAYIVFGDTFQEKILKAIFNINVKTSSLDAEIITDIILSGKVKFLEKELHFLFLYFNKHFYLRLSIAFFAHNESLNIALPTPTRSVFPEESNFSAASASVIPPVNITGIDTASLIDSESSEKYP